MRIFILSIVILVFSAMAMGADDVKAQSIPEEVLRQRQSLQKVNLADIPFSSIKQGGVGGYIIDNEVCIDGRYYRFLVRSPHGDYDVVSARKLGQVLSEITVIERYRATEQGSQAWKGAKSSVANLGGGVKGIVTSPGDSVQGIGRGLGQVLRKLGSLPLKLFEDKDKNKAGDGTDRAKPANSGLGSTELRKFAYELGVDAYSDNVYLQALMLQVAKKRSIGSIVSNIGLNTATFGVGRVLRVTQTPGALNEETELLIRDNGADELKRINKALWKNNLGIEKDKSDALKSFLENANYTPRQSTYIRVFLTKMSTVQGVERAVGILGAVRMPDDADMLASQMELISAYHTKQNKVARLIPIKGYIATQENLGQILLILPCDIVNADEEMVNLLASLRTTANPVGAKITVWLAGVATPGFIRAAQSNVITVEQNVLTKPCFTTK